ncbi:hypothetical protein BDZ89DRAFT_181457 [Hymenopellis radicata]|nr:hypothetical protein BDZ89DRAFT_181457 [Hymenopellis radicata]
MPHLQRHLIADILPQTQRGALPLATRTPTERSRVDAFCREVDLGVLNNLQRIELYLPIAGLFTQRDLAAAQVPALLSQIVSPHFVELSLFVLTVDKMDNLRLVDWSSVVKILNRGILRAGEDCGPCMPLRKR